LPDRVMDARPPACRIEKGVIGVLRNDGIGFVVAMVKYILLAVSLGLMPSYATAQADTGPGRDVAAIDHLIE
jgi:hypothetical protein